MALTLQKKTLVSARREWETGAWQATLAGARARRWTPAVDNSGQQPDMPETGREGGHQQLHSLFVDLQGLSLMLLHPLVIRLSAHPLTVQGPVVPNGITRVAQLLTSDFTSVAWSLSHTGTAAVHLSQAVW